MDIRRTARAVCSGSCVAAGCFAFYVLEHFILGNYIVWAHDARSSIVLEATLCGLVFAWLTAASLHDESSCKELEAPDEAAGDRTGRRDAARSSHKWDAATSSKEKHERRIKSLAKKGDLQAALDEINQARASGEPLEFSMGVYETLMKSVLRNKADDMAQDVCECMLHVGIQPSASIRRCLLRVCLRNGDLNAALELGRPMAESDGTFVMQVFSNHMLDIDTDGAQALFERLLSLGVKLDSQPFLALAHVYARVGNYMATERCLQCMAAHGIQQIRPNYRLMERCLQVQLEAYATAVPSQRARAEVAAGRARTRGLAPSLCLRLFRQYFDEPIADRWMSGESFGT